MITQRFTVCLASAMAGFLTLTAACAHKQSAPNRPVVRSEAVPGDDTLNLAFPGVKGAIPYEKYGEFTNVGTPEYRFVIQDRQGLAEAAGEGIFPNRQAQRNPQYKELLAAGELAGNHWDFVETRTPARNFFKWATAAEDPGVKQFYSAIMLERAGLLEQAVKAFYAVAVHFPKTVSWTYYKTPWYVAPTSLDRIEQLLRRNPDLDMRLEGGRFELTNVYDKNTRTDVIAADPGRLVNGRQAEKPVALSKLKVTKTVGGPDVELKQYENGHWKFFVEGRHFPIRAITYSVTPVGLSPDRGTWNPSRDWQLLDTNNSGQHDGFFESFVDKNRNNIQDADEPTVGDAKLLKDLGINTLRAYHHLYDKELFRRLHREYGIYVLAGDLLGGYATGSGAKWEDGTDYRDETQRQTMLDSVRSMVEEYKDEPYILMWVLGNENVYGVGNNSDEHPEAFFSLVNEAAKMIKEIDPTRPVAHSNGDLAYLDLYAKHCTDVDVFGANVYRGEQGFGRHLFQAVKEMTGQPVLITEYGASAFAEDYSNEEAEAYQAMYLANNWEDLEAHMAGRGTGVALGGVLFEWVDEWWKANADLPDYVKKERAEWYEPRAMMYKNLQPDVQDTVPQFGLPFLDGWSYEEWLGIASIGNGENAAFVRQLRPAYFTLKEMWNP